MRRSSQSTSGYLHRYPLRLAPRAASLFAAKWRLLLTDGNTLLSDTAENILPYIILFVNLFQK
jgi:hypothetical protein